MESLKRLSALALLIPVCFMVRANVVYSSLSFDDTIPSRYQKYYYTQWYDQVPMYGSSDSCWTEKYVTSDRGGGIAKWEYANQPLKVRGLVALVLQSNPNGWGNIHTYRLPEYMYLYQLTYKDSSWQGMPAPWAVTIDLQIVDSVRWDTAQPLYMPIEQGGVNEIEEYVYAYESYFKNPVYVDSDFYIMGSGNSNQRHFDSALNSYAFMFEYKPTSYAEIVGTVNPPKNGWGPDCNAPVNYDWLGSHYARGHVAFYTVGANGGYWHCPWPDNFFGLYLPIVNQYKIDVDVDSAIHGSVYGGGWYPEEWYDTIRAEANAGYRFLHWNDGNTDNPRIVYPSSDTSFTAFFIASDRYVLTVSSDNEEWGTVVGSGNYPENEPVTIEAIPTGHYMFSRWNDGNTDNPRTVYLTQDTAFTAFFAEKPIYNVSVESDNPLLGIVSGSGSYYEDETVIITATAMENGLFDKWNDGNWDNPRTVTVTQDTSFTAFFIDLGNGGTEGIDQAEGLVFSISPNPTKGGITVATGQEGVFKAEIFDLQGRRIKVFGINGPSETIDLSDLPRGRYILRLSLDRHQGFLYFVKK